MRTTTVKLTAFAGGRNLYLTTIKDKTIDEVAREIQKDFCPQESYCEIRRAIQNAVWVNDTITWFAGHHYGVEVVSISDLEARVPVQKTEYAYNV